jgi:alkanesulfonate monooxygenase SsuD/methylene tetrahydromethanopterin reductase-like flavin-dependent oxidoreductase (luciferase family)
MEFGIFVQGYTPQFRRDVDPEAEHHALMNELELVQAADRYGFKYVWATEHHFLDEYSHLSANEVFLGYLASCTERIHLGSGIFNPLPQVNHPAKVAEKVAMLDHLSGGRVEFGTGRGAGSHEILGFLPDMKDLGGTRDIWEDVIREFPKMWTQEEYQGYEGKYWSLPPRKILPKPYVKPHPAMWYAAGNTSSYAMAAKYGLGVLGFSVGSIEEMKPVLAAYKAEVAKAEPIGAFVNDNVMVTAAAFVAENREDGIKAMANGRLSYLQSNVFRYHDTFPHPDWAPKWPELIPDPTIEEVRATVGASGMVVGDPDDALKACQEWADAGADQLVFGQGMATQEEALETIRIIGEHVIPQIDKDPEHSTNRFKREAGAKI